MKTVRLNLYHDSFKIVSKSLNHSLLSQVITAILNVGVHISLDLLL
ncbi:MAG: hypothetical protein Q8S84_02755 [bacterium]|nr:hypothetical protein [bacterium]MDP3380456.1 hypothetical protein [bacterium]